MRITYSSNNSGGGWWLTDEDWHNLAAAGWDVHWEMLKWWLDALATKASKDFATPRDAVAEFERVTGQDADEEGCECCGPPHLFYYIDEAGEYHDLEEAEM